MCIPTHTSSLYLYMFVLYLCQFFADYMAESILYIREKRWRYLLCLYHLCLSTNLHVNIIQSIPISTSTFIIIHLHLNR